MSDASTVGVSPSGSVSSSLQLVYNPLLTSLASALSIGNLSQDTSSLTVLSRLSQQAPVDNYSFNFTSGDSLKLAFNNLTSTTGLRVRLFDSVGNVIADSQGTADQQTAYANLTSSTGLSSGTGTYYVSVSYTPGQAEYGQDYNFQLFSGTTYSSNFTTSALTQAYDPNLFTTASSTIVPASNVTVYQRNTTAPQLASPSLATSIGTLVNNQTALNVLGSVGSNGLQQEDFVFANNQQGPVKLNLTNSTDTGNLHVVLLDSTGTQIIADNLGTDAQKLSYLELTSGAGLNLSKSNFVVQVSTIAGQYTPVQNYNFQLYSGSTYSDFYDTSVQSGSSSSSTYTVGHNLNIYADIKAQVGTRQSYNTINATASSAVNIGWLQENKTALKVISQLTQSDNADFYSFNLQSGQSLKLSATNSTNASALHLQIYDQTGTHIFADNQGTSAQQAAFAQLTSDNGLKSAAGNYLLKVSYGANSNHATTLNYNVSLYSGTTYTTLDETIASAQTLGNFLLSGGSFGYVAGSGISNYLQNLTNYANNGYNSPTAPGPNDVFSTLSTFA